MPHRTSIIEEKKNNNFRKGGQVLEQKGSGQEVPNDLQETQERAKATWSLSFQSEELMLPLCPPTHYKKQRIEAIPESLF